MCVGGCDEARSAESPTLRYLDLKGEYSPLLVEEKSREKTSYHRMYIEGIGRLCLAGTNQGRRKLFIYGIPESEGGRHRRTRYESRVWRCQMRCLWWCGGAL